MEGVSFGRLRGFSSVMSASHWGHGRSTTSTPTWERSAASRTLERSSAVPTNPTTTLHSSLSTIASRPHPIGGSVSAGTTGAGGLGSGAGGSGLGGAGAGGGGRGSRSSRIENPCLTRLRNVSYPMRPNPPSPQSVPHEFISQEVLIALGVPDDGHRVTSLVALRYPGPPDLATAELVECTVGEHPDNDGMSARELALHLVESLGIDHQRVRDPELRGARSQPRTGLPAASFVVGILGVREGSPFEKVQRIGDPRPGVARGTGRANGVVDEGGARDLICPEAPAAVPGWLM